MNASIACAGHRRSESSVDLAEDWVDRAHDRHDVGHLVPGHDVRQDREVREGRAPPFQAIRLGPAVADDVAADLAARAFDRACIPRPWAPGPGRPTSRPAATRSGPRGARRAPAGRSGSTGGTRPSARGSARSSRPRSPPARRSRSRRRTNTARRAGRRTPLPSRGSAGPTRRPPRRLRARSRRRPACGRGRTCCPPASPRTRRAASR